MEKLILRNNRLDSGAWFVTAGLGPWVSVVADPPLRQPRPSESFLEPCRILERAGVLCGVVIARHRVPSEAQGFNTLLGLVGS